MKTITWDDMAEALRRSLFSPVTKLPDDHQLAMRCLYENVHILKEQGEQVVQPSIDPQYTTTYAELASSK